MGQTIIKGIGEDGIFKTEYKSTPVLRKITAEKAKQEVADE